MKKVLMGTLIMIAGLFTLATGAQAQAGIVAHIGQDFVAGGKAVPAGTYKVYQGTPETGLTLVLRGEEPGSSIFLIPSTHDGAVAGPLELKLTRAGDSYYLSEIVTESGLYTFSQPRTLTGPAEAKNQGGGVATPGTN